MPNVAERKLKASIETEKHKRNIHVSRGDLLIIHRKVNHEEGRKMVDEILNASRIRSGKVSSRDLLEKARNERG